MKEQRADCVDKLLRPSGPRKFCADVDVLKTEEWKRRRLLRLEQVRQQSKDIASNIRRKVFVEKNNLMKDLQRKTEIAVTQWKEEKLNALQNELTQTLSCVGSAHKEAEHEEVNRPYKTDHLEAADRRGREALLRLRSEEHTRKQAEETRKLQRLQVRSVEEARSAVLVSLPVPKSTVPAGNIVHPPKSDVVQQEKLSESCLKVWPSRMWSVSVPLGVTPANVNNLDSPRINSSSKSVPTSERKDDTSSVVVPKQEIETVSILSSRQRTSSYEAPTETSSSGNTASERSKRSVPVALAKRKEEPREVELYDCANSTYKQYVKPSVVCMSVPPEPIDGLEAAEACASNAEVKKDLSRTSALKLVQRGKEAMKRVQTRREHQALLSDLANLVRQQAALSSLPPSQNLLKVEEKHFDVAIVGLDGLLNFRSEDSEKIPCEEAEGSGRLQISSQSDETIIDVCSPDEADNSFRERLLIENRAVAGRSVAISKEELNAPIHGQKGVTVSEVKPPEKATEKEGENNSVSMDDTRWSTSTGMDVPKVNLALWTSRSSNNSERGESTLTPSDKVPSESVESSTQTDSVNKTLTPSVKRGESFFTSSTTSSTSEHAPSENVKTAPSQDSNPSVKSQSERVAKKVRSQKHLRSEDDSLQRGTIEKKTSLKKAPKVNNSRSECDASRKVNEGITPRETNVNKGRSKKESPASSGSTSYMSLPNKLLSAITDDLRSLLSLTRGRKDAPQTNPLLAHYINRLLDMSRQSVERLNVMTSDICTPPSALFQSDSHDSSTRRSTSRSVLSGADEPDRLSKLMSMRSDVTLSSSSGDDSGLVNVMQQCCARITALSQMIEQVRQENLVATPVPVCSRRSPSLHLDSTAYLSPPSTIAAYSKIAPRTSNFAQTNNLVDDTYSAAITRFVSEIRQQLAKQSENPIQMSLQPSSSSAVNMKRSSSNELSTIFEQDRSFVEWPSAMISSETCGSSEEVEKEFSRMGLGWAGTTLRKTKEAFTLDSNSSSDFLEFSALSMFGSYSHSTPIKTTDDVKRVVS